MTAEINEHGLLSASPATVFTYGGGTFEPLNPDPAQLDIETIAHSLSQQCRWTGHTSSFYSVAEHCVLASWMVAAEWQLQTLLHDASEAYLSDLARPIKKAPGLGEVYCEVEGRLEAAIAERWGLQLPLLSEPVKHADEAMLRREAEALVPHLGELMPDPPAGTPRVHCWSPETAKKVYLDAFEQYGGARC